MKHGIIRSLHRIIQIGFLVLFYAIGLLVQKVTHLPVPGSIIGMILLFILLLTKRLPVRFIDMGSRALLNHLQLLFIPVTVGVIDYLSYFVGSGIISLVVVLISTSLVLILTGLTTQHLLLKDKEDVSA